MSKYEYNKEIFSTIQTEEEAYWLGFLLADGYNIDDKMIRVDIKDKGHLEKLSKLIYPKGDKPVAVRDLGFGPIYYFSCNILSIVESLRMHGIVPRKSKIAKMPNINKNLVRHFIRGLFDGDGSICYTMDKNYRRYQFNIVGTEELLLDVKNFILNDLCLNLSHGKMKMIYRIYKKGNQQIMTLLNWLYEDSNVYLERKYNIYQDMLEYYKNKK